MKNTETGESREMSMEELMVAMREGKVSVQQEVHHADGSVTSSTIYGNDVGDGIDRSLNIFGTMSDIFTPVIQIAKRIREEDEDAEKLFHMDDSDVDYEVTVDDTQMPIFHIITCTKEGVKIARYTRDERKMVGTPMEDLSILFEKGEISATLEEVQENNLALFAFGVHEIRKVLRERGILQELQKFGNKASGVIIAASEDSFEARIVRGHARPDLPCMMFGGLFANGPEDAVMMRPYVDELMTDALYEDMSLDEKAKQAEAGDTDLMDELAMRYLNGDDEVEANPEKAVYWFRKLAEAGESNGMFNLGLHYAKGFGIERSFKDAVYWFEKAAENGDEDAPVIIEKLKKAVAAEEIISTGDAQAQADLAATYMFLGNSLDQAGPEKDYELALDFAKKSAAQNNGDGLWALALAYEHGRGVKQDKQKAVEYYRKGADVGHAPSQHSLACYYFRGEILEQDNERGFELCMKSAEQGYGLAMANVGRCYQFGNGVADDMGLAIEWYEKSLQVLPDPELERKVAIFKSMEDSGMFENEYERELPEGYKEALQAFLGDEEEYPRTSLENLLLYYGVDFDPEKETVVLTEEVVGTQFEGRNDRIERIQVGDILNLVREPENEKNEQNISVRNQKGESLGNLSAGTCRVLAPVMDDNAAKKITTEVCEVVPLSKRGPRARKAILNLKITLELENVVSCMVCKLAGDQVNIWAQKLTVGYSTMAVNHAKLMFELYNRFMGEYDNLDQGQNDTSYAGLDNLEEEIRAAREKMQLNRNAECDYSKGEEFEDFGFYVQKMIVKDASRYGELIQYEIYEYDQLWDILERYMVASKNYYWLDQTRVTEEEFDEIGWYNHWYEIVELYDGKELPVDLSDEDIVSIFGCGKFAAFADLSYGC